MENNKNEWYGVFVIVIFIGFVLFEISIISNSSRINDLESKESKFFDRYTQCVSAKNADDKLYNNDSYSWSIGGAPATSFDDVNVLINALQVKIDASNKEINAYEKMNGCIFDNLDK